MGIALVCRGCGESFTGSRKLIGALCGTGRVECAHERKVPHALGDGSGGWRWTCSDCYADLRERS